MAPEPPGPHPKLCGVQSLVHPSAEPPATPGEETPGALVTPGTRERAAGSGHACRVQPYSFILLK